MLTTSLNCVSRISARSFKLQDSPPSYLGCRLADVADTPGPIPSPSNLPQGHFPPSPLLIAADKQWLDYYRRNPIFYELLVWTFAYAQNPVCFDAYKEARRAFEDLNQRLYGDPSQSHQTASHDRHATTRVSVSPTSPLPPPAAAWSEDQDSAPTEANPADTDAHMESGPTVSDLVHEGISEVLQAIDGLRVSSLSSDAVDSLRSLALALHTFLGADHPTSLSGLTTQPLAQCMQPVPQPLLAPLVLQTDPLPLAGL